MANCAFNREILKRFYCKLNQKRQNMKKKSWWEYCWEDYIFRKERTRIWKIKMENRKLWNKWNDVANLLTFVFTNLNSRINEGFKEEIRRSGYFNRKNRRQRFSILYGSSRMKASTELSVRVSRNGAKVFAKWHYNLRKIIWHLPKKWISINLEILNCLMESDRLSCSFLFLLPVLEESTESVNYSWNVLNSFSKFCVKPY